MWYSKGKHMNDISKRAVVTDICIYSTCIKTGTFCLRTGGGRGLVTLAYTKRIFSIFEQVIRYNLVWGSLRLINCEGNCFKSGYTSITSSQISNISYNVIFTTKFNDFSILISIISWDYLNQSFANDNIGEVTIPIQVIKCDQWCFRRIGPITLQY